MSCNLNKYMRIMYNMALVKPEIVKNDGIIKETSRSITQNEIAKIMYNMALVKPDKGVISEATRYHKIS